MKVLVVTPAYPHAGHPFSGIFNEKSVAAMHSLCESVEVLTPRPYSPFFLSFVPRWKAYAGAKWQELRNGVTVYRPATPVIPRVGGALWVDSVAFRFCRSVAKRMHMRRQFDAILSFDLVGTGGLAWRLGRDLGIPAFGWATGGDVRVPKTSSFGRSVIRALEHLRMVFYQSRELLEKAADLLDVTPNDMDPDRHMVLPRGIPEPPSLQRAEIRASVRKELKISGDAILILNVGRISRDKGIFELLDSIAIAGARDSRIVCIVVGSIPAFDETTVALERLNTNPDLKNRVRILPACSPDKVWEYLCAADIFAFASHHEGMPNSLLEAMAIGLPSIAFAIPPVTEIDAGMKSLVTIAPLNSTLFADAILRLAGSPEERAQIGERAKTRVSERFMVRKNMAVALGCIERAKNTYKADSCETAFADNF